MGLVDRLFDAMRSTVEMRGDVDRVTKRVDGLADMFLDHEKRLVRLETRDEMRVVDAPRRPRLPRRD